MFAFFGVHFSAEKNSLNYFLLVTEYRQGGRTWYWIPLTLLN